MKKLVLATIIICTSVYTNNTFAQCSDAGVCSLGGNATEEGLTAAFVLSLGYSYGYSGKEDDISYSSIKVGGSYHFLDEASFNFSIPFNIQSGPWFNYNVHGIGDLLFNLRYSFKFDKSRLSLSAGMRLSTAYQNKNYVFQPYSSGLGTNDILFGADYLFSNFLIGAGYQIAGKRGEDIENLFVVERGDDLLLRAGWFYDIDRFSINPQLLFIKRLGKSSILIPVGPDAIGFRAYVDAPGSDQSQLNLLVNATYNVNENYSHFIEVAVPFLERDNNVDGLKRTFTIST